jgi:hypothetical protein
MSTLDPAIRDLLVAIHEALNAAEVRDYPVCAVQTAIRSTVLYGRPALQTGWLLEDPQLAEAADARRVRSADRWDLYQASKEVPA